MTGYFKTINLAFEQLGDREWDHQLTYYIDRQLTLDEWIALDEAFNDVFDRLGLLDEVFGIADPIPPSGE